MPTFTTTPLDQIEERHIQELVDDKIQELRIIEYKRDLTVNTDKEKKEFLADVSSFANAAGGSLLFGVQEKSGIPTALPGIQVLDPDALCQKLESMIQSSVQPRLLCDLQPVPLQGGGVVLVLRIRRSWVGPHMVTFKGSSRFYARGNTGKFQLDVHQLRDAFLAVDGLSSRMRDFRTERVGRVLSNTAILPLPYGGKVIVHVLPQQAFLPGAAVDTAKIMGSSECLRPMFHEHVGRFTAARPNFEGAVSHATIQDRHYGYMQLFRNGCLEVADTLMLDREHRALDDPKKPRPPNLFITELEKEIITIVSDQLRVTYKVLGVKPPFFVCVTITGVSGFRLEFPGRGIRDQRQIPNENLSLPEVQVDDLDANIAQALKPAFDILWNAAGYERSLNYDKETGARLAPDGPQ